LFLLLIFLLQDWPAISLAGAVSYQLSALSLDLDVAACQVSF